MKDLKLGIIGTNFVSDWLCDAVKETDGISSSAVYSRTHEKGSEFAAKHGIGCVYTDMDEFLAPILTRCTLLLRTSSTMSTQ